MALERGIFSTPRRAWTAVAAYTLFLYSSATLAFNTYVWLLERQGKVVFQAMTWMYVPIGLLLLLSLLFFFPRRLGSYLAFVLICLALALALQYLVVPAKRFHFFQYGIVTFLVVDALRFRFRGRCLYVWSLAAVALIGLGDEAVQSLMPKRHFGLLDLGVDAVAGLLTLAFIGFVIGEENYPWGSLSQGAGGNRPRERRS